MLLSSPASSTQRPSTPEVSDSALASRAAAGDDAAFADLYRRHHLRVYRYCRRLLRCPEDAADATQQTFLNMHRRLAKGYPPDASVGGYLLRVAQHASFEVHERRQAQHALAERHDAATTEPDHAPAVVTAHAVRNAATSLPERHLAVLVMREVEDLTYLAWGGRRRQRGTSDAWVARPSRKRRAPLSKRWFPWQCELSGRAASGVRGTADRSGGAAYGCVRSFDSAAPLGCVTGWDASPARLVTYWAAEGRERRARGRICRRPRLGAGRSAGAGAGGDGAWTSNGKERPPAAAGTLSAVPFR